MYGEVSDNQTTIPLDAKAAVQSVEPKSLAVTGQLKQKQILIDLVKGSTTPSYVAGEKGKGILAVQVKISCTPTILVDGKPSSLFSGPSRNQVLQQLPASAFERVEVMTNPSAAYRHAADSSPLCCEALYPGNVFEGPKETVQFKVPLPIQGAYAVTFADQGLVNQGSPGSSTVVTAL